MESELYWTQLRKGTIATAQPNCNGKTLGNAFIQDGMKNFTGTAGQQRVGKDFISNYLVPLPPVAEQKRIVQQANFVIESCDIL